MAKQVKNTNGITRPFYDRQPQDRQHFVAMPRFNEYPAPNENLFAECGKLNEQWRPHVNGVLSVLLDSDLWEGQAHEKERATQLMYILMEWLFTCEDDDMPQLRPSSTDPCVMEQLINGQWILAMDFGACLNANMPQVPTQTLIDNIPPILEGTQDVFDAIVANGVTTEYPYTQNSPSDTLNAPKNGILCATLRAYINRLADFIQQMAQSQAEGKAPNFGQVLTDFGLTAGSSWALSGLLAPVTGGASLWLNLARVGAGVTLVTNAGRAINSTGQLISDIRTAYFDDNKTAVVIDVDQRNEIICILYDGLKDKSLTQANFDSAVGNLPEDTTIQQKIKNIISILFLSNVTYAEFIVFYNQAMVAQQTGAEFEDNECGCNEPPLECGISYNWLTYDSSPIDVTFYESVPFNALPVRIYPPPMTAIAPQSPFVVNQFVSIYQVYELPCNLPISCTWWRANTNSGSATIETYDGVEWTVRATTDISVGTVSAFKRSMLWANPTEITYQGCRIRVTSPAPRIDTFVIG